MKPAAIFAAALGAVLLAATSGAQQDDQAPTASGPIRSVSFNFLPGRMINNIEFRITLKHDGTATYMLRHSAGSGTYRASGLTQEFADIAKKVEDAGYWKLQPHYGRKDEQFPYAVVSVSTANGSKSVIDAGAFKHSGMLAPPGLKQVELMMAGLAKSAPWKKVSDKTTFTSSSADGGQG